MFNVLAKSACFSETTPKLCAHAENNTLQPEEVFTEVYTSVKYLQGEYPALMVHKSFDPNAILCVTKEHWLLSKDHETTEKRCNNPQCTPPSKINKRQRRTKQISTKKRYSNHHYITPSKINMRQRRTKQRILQRRQRQQGRQIYVPHGLWHRRREPDHARSLMRSHHTPHPTFPSTVQYHQQQAPKYWSASRNS